MASRSSRFVADLSGATLTGVLDAYSAFVRKTHVNYTNSSVINAIRRFEADCLDSPLLPIDVSDIFWTEFREYLFTTPNYRGNTIKPSSFATYRSMICAALAYGSKHGARIDDTYRSCEIDNYKKTKIALSTSQIAHIFYYDIDANKERIKHIADEMGVHRFSFASLKRVRDHFVFSCQIGQRYSDSSAIAEDNLDASRTVLSVTQQKTGAKAVVNIPKYCIDKKIAYDILERYHYTAPAIGMDINNYNKLLHVLVRSIGGEFDKVVSTTNKVNGALMREDMPMWRYISSHTARRTLITHLLRRGVDLMHIQRVSGHKELKHLQRYVILDDDE